jgi:membrane associated rhomboid family serine protease
LPTFGALSWYTANLSLNPIPFIFAVGLALWAYVFGGLDGVLWALGAYGVLIGGATAWVLFRRRRSRLRDRAAAAHGAEDRTNEPHASGHGLGASRRL